LILLAKGRGSFLVLPELCLKIERERSIISNFQKQERAVEAGGILLLDEVISCIYSAVNARIQRIIRKEFKKYTAIVVTRRENAVRDFDRMIIMENRIIKEAQNSRESVCDDGYNIWTKYFGISELFRPN
jgi:ABC-type transport system involved in Fe-S cluster assembly fused permease/ATPase subunit